MDLVPEGRRAEPVIWVGRGRPGQKSDLVPVRVCQDTAVTDGQPQAVDRA